MKFPAVCHFTTIFQRAVLVAVVFFLCSVSVHAANKWLETGSDLVRQTLESEKTAPGDEEAVSGSDPTSGQMIQAFKEALTLAAGSVVDQVGTLDGFNDDAAIHIPLPQSMEKVRSVLSRAGLSGMADDLELKLNRAAEAAAPKARDLFFQSIQEMTFADVQAVYQGPRDSATRYFREKMAPSLADEMRPVVEQTLNQVGAVQAYDRVMGRYQKVPFVPDVKADLTRHVLDRGMDGIFYYMAREEAAIRDNPMRQTTDLLKKVFGR